MSTPGSPLILFANDENIGDALSARGIEWLLARPCELFPFEGRIPVLARRLDRCGPADLVIAGGGGLLKSSFDRFWSIVVDAQRRRSFRLVVWGVGVCDVKGQETRGCRDLHDEVANRCSLLAVRDQRSLSCFSDPAAGVVTGCPSVPFARGALAGGGQVEPHVLVVDHPGLLEAMGFPAGDGALTRVVESAARDGQHTIVSIDNLVQLPKRPLPRDLAARLVPGRWERRRIHRRQSTYVRVHYAQAELVVTSRLHGAMIAAALNVPWLALSGDHKIEGFAELVGEVHRVVESTDALHDRLVDDAWRERSIGVSTIVDRTRDFAYDVSKLLDRSTRS